MYHELNVAQFQHMVHQLKQLLLIVTMNRTALIQLVGH